ncbi:hypothetical protein COU49_02545 [Candidatus Nomurabacteria bacterium CG10_big_fil_rev_8_21_14_0_10_35_16]|uniref:Uncharacterized protein n=1 Tax=Candidatus Nomurabacteria bacterium CG10_big_fil_rev_8_21_14_0_10_35_16 TaxID=1974731 RepID=A0A2H0TB01_9BACT|nr:MAG: hypothetical protein COU49_02545 [Candidatus Nomurabacteria bacterium CG10_big_fil_rev_8_21_14_0_10_35_16]
MGNIFKQFKEKRECWLLQEFLKALKKENPEVIKVECGEEGSGDGRLIIDNVKIPVQIVTAERVLYEKSAQAKKSKEVVAYSVEPAIWIKEALEKKVIRNYPDEKELIILIDYSDLRAVNKDYILNELRTKEIVTLAEHFRDVYILTPSDGEFVDRSEPLNEPILIKI